MQKHVLLYGMRGGVLIALLKAIEYRYLVVEHSVAIYGALVALVFLTFGIWLGLRITGRKERVVVREVAVPAPATFTLNEAKLAAIGMARTGNTGTHRRGFEQQGDRRTLVREREHGQDPFEARV